MSDDATLEPGHIATMYHEGTKKFYEARVIERPFPQSREVERCGDMSRAVLRVMLDGDEDVSVSILGGELVDGVEFCTLQGGGKSPKTRAALIALMVAIETEDSS